MSQSARTELSICNQRGLHARASAKFVKAASEFEAQINVIKDGTTVDARSIMGLLMLGAGIGSTITVTADGPDADTAIATLSALVNGRFDEEQ